MKLLLKTNHLKQWRHSSFGNYWIHDIEGKKAWLMTPPSQPPITAYAIWFPTGQSIVYVTPSSTAASESPISVTSPSSASLFNNVPDWVYEGEVSSSNFSLWWSPELAFLHLDETLVEECTYPVYTIILPKTRTLWSRILIMLR